MSKLRDFISILSGFRKFVIILLVLIIGVIFRIVGYVNGAEVVDLIKGVTIAYMSFNGVEHLTSAIKEWIIRKSENKAP